MPWEFCFAEWDAQFLGDRAYRISEMEKANLRWEAGSFARGALVSAGIILIEWARRGSTTGIR